MLSSLRKINGFTLVEVLVTVTIISILAGIIAVNSIDSGKQSRDEKRQADLRNFQSSLELYKNKYGRYPEQCVASGVSANGWSGQLGTDFACDNGTNSYILGDTGRLFTEFMPRLPIDPKLNGTNSGYVYRTNTNGTVYKLMAINSVEGEVVGYSHPLKSCDIIPGTNGIDYPGTTVNQIDAGGWCSQVPNSIIASPITPRLPYCTMSMHGGDGRFDRSYGVWGGFEAKVGGGNEATKARNTTTVICR